jgi:hypothetical protein
MVLCLRLKQIDLEFKLSRYSTDLRDQVLRYIVNTSKFSARRTQWQLDLKDFVDYKGFKANRVSRVHKGYKESKENRGHRETVEIRAHKVIQDLQVHRGRKDFEVWHPRFQDLRDLLASVLQLRSMVEVQRLHSPMDLLLTVEVLYKFLIN